MMAATWRQRSASGRATGGVSAARLHSALVAQWREQRFPKPRVAGSIPAEGTTSTSGNGLHGEPRRPKLSPDCRQRVRGDPLQLLTDRSPLPDAATQDPSPAWKRLVEPDAVLLCDGRDTRAVRKLGGYVLDGIRRPMEGDVEMACPHWCPPSCSIEFRDDVPG